MAIINRKKDGSKWNRSSLEEKFERIWLKLFPEIDLVVEQYLVEGRRWRWDFYCPAKGVVIEVHGGQFSRSSHKSKGHKDALKQNAAVMLGFKPIVLWTSSVNEEEIAVVGDWIKSL